MLILAVMCTAGCQLSLTSPTPASRAYTMSVAVPVPTRATRADVDAAESVFKKRLNVIGVTSFTVSVGPTMQFALVVPDSVETKAVNEVLRVPGVVTWLAWPDSQPAAEPGDDVPPGATPLFDASTQIMSADPSSAQQGQAGIDIRLAPEATSALAAYTASHVGQPLPIALDGVVLTSPIIQSPISDGHLILTGPQEEDVPVVALAAILASGPLPAAWRH